MESPEEISENGATEPSQTETPVISSDYDPSIPTDEKGTYDLLLILLEMLNAIV